MLAAVGSHLTNAQIASRLHLSVRTVDSHVASLLRKLGVANRRALAELAPAVGAGPALGTGIVGLPEAWTSLVGRQDEVERPHRPVRCAVKFPLSLALTGSFDEASITAESMWSAWLAAGRPYAGGMGASLLGAALAHGLRGHTGAYEEWLRRTARLFPEGDMWEQWNTGTVAAFSVARVALHAGDVEEARSVLARYLDHPPPSPAGALSYFDPYPRALAADIAAAAASPDAPALIDGAGPAAAENRWAAACVDRARGRLHDDPDLIEQAAQAFADIDARFEQACTLLLLPHHAARARRLFTDLDCPPPA